MASKKRKTKPAKGKPKAKSKAKPKARAVKKAAGGPALPRDLQTRLLALAVQMEKTMDALMLQALCEFADAWEEHYRTVKELQDDDRVQLVVKPE